MGSRVGVGRVRGVLERVVGDVVHGEISLGHSFIRVFIKVLNRTSTFKSIVIYIYKLI